MENRRRRRPAQVAQFSPRVYGRHVPGGKRRAAAMIAPALTVLLQDGRRTYEPNDVLSVEYRLDSTAHVEAKAMEASVVWYTMGKGDEDFGVHHFVRHAADEGSVLDCRKPQRL